MHRYWRSGSSGAINVYTDASWASDSASRQSSPGGVAIFDGRRVESWSAIQSLVASSSAKSGLYASVKAIVEAWGVQPMAGDFEPLLTTIAMAVASAALGIISRGGSAKFGILDANHRWIQEAVAKRRATCDKTFGFAHPVGMMTKDVLLDRHVEFIGACHLDGRGQGASKIAIDEAVAIAQGNWPGDLNNGDVGGEGATYQIVPGRASASRTKRSHKKRTRATVTRTWRSISN